MSREFFVGFSESTGKELRPFLQGFSEAMVDVPGGVILRTYGSITRLLEYLSENNLEAHIQIHQNFSATVLRDNRAYMEFFKGNPQIRSCTNVRDIFNQ